jgi:hypothetical protein
VCPECGQRDIDDQIYSEDMIQVKLVCNCGVEYCVDLSAENLLKTL